MLIGQIFWSEEELRELNGTNLGLVTDKLKRQVQEVGMIPPNANFIRTTKRCRDCLSCFLKFLPTQKISHLTHTNGPWQQYGQELSILKFAFLAICNLI
jgi:hypothetical protein